MDDKKQPPDPEFEDLEDDDSDEFIPCDKCDGHDACADFGCAFELGLGRMVKRPPGSLDDWS